jgi:phosphoribosylglycinamide formyltransferase-1
LSSTRARIVVLISGEGTNLQALIDAIANGSLPAQIALVASNREAARGLSRARMAGIPAQHFSTARGSDRNSYDAALGNLVAAHAPDLVVLAGFMRILGTSFVHRFRGRMFNIHPSLLPKYPGLDTHRRVLASGDRQHGATVHFVTADLDAGPPIVQYRFSVRPEDDVESLAARVHVGEHLILPRAVDWFVSGRLRLDSLGVMLDGQRLDSPVIVEEGQHADTA